MPIPNYVRPQTEIYQQLEITIEEVGSQMQTCVIGPQYDLYRYGKEELPSIPFTTSEQIVPYTFSQYGAYDYEVDLHSVKLYAEGLLANLATFSNKVKLDKKDKNIIRLADGKLFADASGRNLATELKHYGVQIGDQVRVTAKEGDDESRICTVMDVVGVPIPPVVTAEKAQVVNSASVDFTLTSGEDVYEGEDSTNYILTVGDDGAITVTDTAGIDVSDIILPVDGVEFRVGSYGVKASITGLENLVPGDILSISCVAEGASTTVFDGLYLDRIPVSMVGGNLPDVLYEVTLLKEFNGEVCAGNGVQEPFTADGEQVVIHQELALYIKDQASFAYFEEGSGKLFLQFRVLVLPPEDEEKFELRNITEVQEAFGSVDPDNDIAYGCYAALEGAAGRSVFALRTRGIDEEAFLAAAKKSETDKDMYAYVVMTESEDVAAAVAEYNVSLCQPDIKMFRRTFWGVECPGPYSFATTDENGKPLQATFSSMTGDTNDTNNTLVQLSAANKIDLKAISYQGLITTVRPGDMVQLSVNGQSYPVKRLLSSTEILLETGPKTEVDQNKNITLIHSNTPLNRREYVQQVCSRFNSLRKTVVWSDGATYDGDPVANKYLAAYVAGLASSVVPQQSMTRSEVTLVDNAAKTYTQYTREELDDIARFGCLVVAQDTKNGPCYVRHNLTTETDKGLMYYEESCIRNIDNMSFKTDAALQRFIGRANVVPSALRAIYRDLTDLFTQFTENSASELIGPQLVSFSDLKIEQDPTLKSRVIVTVNWYVPAPLNNIRVYEKAFIADVTLEGLGNEGANEITE